MRIGFTGTQKGMTRNQKAMTYDYLRDVLFQSLNSKVTLENLEAHHGDCIGADVQFNDIANLLGFTTFAHPASDTGHKRAYCKVDIALLAKPALVRNRDIVNSVDVMIAAPTQDHEVLRSGTWATIRYARKVGRSIHVIYP